MAGDAECFADELCELMRNSLFGLIAATDVIPEEYGPTGCDEAAFLVAMVGDERYVITVGAVHNPDSDEWTALDRAIAFEGE